MSEFILKSARFIAKEYLEKTLKEGDIVVDATMGNGYDTLFLCQLVKETGHVYAFDVQEQALLETEKRLKEHNCSSCATLILDGHQNMDKYVQEKARVVLFNLGWLPGSDKVVRTMLQTTLEAVQKALGLLQPLGVLIMCIYPGHDEGMKELQALTDFFTALRPQQYNCLMHTFLNAGKEAPHCVIVQKQA